jgi:phage recombination protein Bet
MSGHESGTGLVPLRDLTPDTPVAIQTADGMFEISIRDVQRWLHPTAPPGEILKLLMVCKQSQVNPLLGEAHLVNHGSSWSVIIDKSGYLRRAQAHPMYAGHQAGIIIQPFDFAAKRPTGEPREIEGAYLPPGHLVRGGWARIYRADRPAVPTYVAVGMDEYNKGQSSWKTIPCTMIRKVAVVQALRESGLCHSGWYDPAEVTPEPHTPGGVVRIERADVRTPSDVPLAIEVEFERVVDASCPPDLAVAIESARDQLNIPANSHAWASALAKRGVSSVVEMSAREATELLDRLNGMIEMTRDVISSSEDEWAKAKEEKESQATDAPPEQPEPVAAAATTETANAETINDDDNLPF